MDTGSPPNSAGLTSSNGESFDLEKQNLQASFEEPRNSWNPFEKMKCLFHRVLSFRVPSLSLSCTTGEETLPVVRSLTTFTRGYPNLAAFHDSEEEFMLYRRFGYMQARVILDKQDQLRLLEVELDQFDKDNEGCAVSREPNKRNGEAMQKRSELLQKVDQALTSYTSSLTNAQQLMGFNKPSYTEHRSVSRYLENYKPVKDPERTYVNHKEDLVTLRPGREHAWLDRTIESALRGCQGRLPFVHHWFCSKETSQKTGESEMFKDVFYYTRERINGLAVFLITLAILALLIVPIWLLYHLVSQTNGVLSDRGNAICIGILLISTLLFSAVLSLFTRARRHEILAAAAAYCAVLVVFLGNVRPSQ